MLFNAHADSAGLPPISSPSVLSFCQSYELHDPEVYPLLSPNPYKLLPDNIVPQSTLSGGCELSGFIPVDPGLCYDENHSFIYHDTFLNFNPDIEGHSRFENFSSPPPLLYTPPAHYQSTTPVSPWSSNSSAEFVNNFSQLLTPSLPSTTLPSSFPTPFITSQLNHIGNEIQTLENDSTIPFLGFETSQSAFLSNNLEVPVSQPQQPWSSVSSVEAHPPFGTESGVRRKAVTFKRALPNSGLNSRSCSSGSTCGTKSDRQPRAKKALRSSHVILTDAPISVTQGGYARKYACTWEGCGKAFTTSGHLVRHKRIHTGEKRYECAMENCNSRFSRQDNMLQHYRTHLSAKSRKVPSVSSTTSRSSNKSKNAPNLSSPSLLVPQMMGFDQFLMGHNSF